MKLLPAWPPDIGVNNNILLLVWKHELFDNIYVHCCYLGRAHCEDRVEKRGGHSSIFVLLPCRSWINDFNVHVQDTVGTVGINEGDGVVLLLAFRYVTGP